MTYTAALTEAMTELAADPRTLFVGQAVRYGGQAANSTFAMVPDERKIEMPVAEDFQLGFCTGLALAGYVPVSFFPRWDFLLIAANQLVNHLDKLPMLGDFRPKVIVRTAVGRMAPLNPGPQHTQNHTEAFCLMLKRMTVIELLNTDDVANGYRTALKCPESVIVVEHMAMYG